ncbi:hypothetical protein GQ457_03G017800 [Hibiscus cannabinus]
MQNHTYCITKVFNPFPDCTSGSDTTAYSEFLDKQQILLWMFSRTHELTNKLISKAPRSNRQATKRTPSLSVTGENAPSINRRKNHNFDFLLK